MFLPALSTVLGLVLHSGIICLWRKYYIHSPYISLNNASQQFNEKTNYLNEPNVKEWMKNGRSDIELCFEHLKNQIFSKNLDLYTYNFAQRTYERENIQKYEFFMEKDLVSQMQNPKLYLKKEDLEKIISQYIKDPYEDINPCSEKS